MKRINNFMNLGSVLLVIAILIISLVSSDFLIPLEPKDLSKSEDIKFADFYLCSGPNPETGGLTLQKSEYELGTKEIFLCGDLKTSKPVRIVVAWRKENQDLAISSSNNNYEEGYVFMKLDKELEIGNYSVIAVYYHETIGKAEFSIVPNK